MTTKICTKCKIEKSTNEFIKDKNKKDGYYSSCKDCRKEYLKNNKEKRYQYNKEYWKQNRDKLIQQNKDYRNDNLEKCLESSRNYYYKNKEKCLENKKEYYLKNMEAIKQYKKELRANATEEQKEKERLRGRTRSANRRAVTGNHMSIKTIRTLLAQYGYKCYYCESKINQKEKNSFHIDHYIPIAKGGTNEISNLVISCPTCNMSKGAKMPEEFMIKFGKLL